MMVPAHTGLEHPNLLWLVVIGVFTFIAGLIVNLSRSTDDGDVNREPTTGDE